MITEQQINDFFERNQTSLAEAEELVKKMVKNPDSDLTQPLSRLLIISKRLRFIFDVKPIPKKVQDWSSINLPWDVSQYEGIYTNIVDRINILCETIFQNFHDQCAVNPLINKLIYFLIRCYAERSVIGFAVGMIMRTGGNSVVCEVNVSADHAAMQEAQLFGQYANLKSSAFLWDKMLREKELGGIDDKEYWLEIHKLFCLQYMQALAVLFCIKENQAISARKEEYLREESLYCIMQLLQHCSFFIDFTGENPIPDEDEIDILESVFGHVEYFLEKYSSFAEKEGDGFYGANKILQKLKMCLEAKKASSACQSNSESDEVALVETTKHYIDFNKYFPTDLIKKLKGENQAVLLLSSAVVPTDLYNFFVLQKPMSISTLEIFSEFLREILCDMPLGTPDDREKRCRTAEDFSFIVNYYYAMLGPSEKYMTIPLITNIITLRNEWDLAAGVLSLSNDFSKTVQAKKETLTAREIQKGCDGYLRLFIAGFVNVAQRKLNKQKHDALEQQICGKTMRDFLGFIDSRLDLSDPHALVASNAVLYVLDKWRSTLAEVDKSPNQKSSAVYLEQIKKISTKISEKNNALVLYKPPAAAPASQLVASNTATTSQTKKRAKSHKAKSAKTIVAQNAAQPVNKKKYPAAAPAELRKEVPPETTILKQPEQTTVSTIKRYLCEALTKFGKTAGERKEARMLLKQMVNKFSFKDILEHLPLTQEYLPLLESIIEYCKSLKTPQGYNDAIALLQRMLEFSDAWSYPIKCKIAKELARVYITVNQPKHALSAIDKIVNTKHLSYRTKVAQESIRMCCYAMLSKPDQVLKHAQKLREFGAWHILKQNYLEIFGLTEPLSVNQLSIERFSRFPASYTEFLMFCFKQDKQYVHALKLCDLLLTMYGKEGLLSKQNLVREYKIDTFLKMENFQSCFNELTKMKLPEYVDDPDLHAAHMLRKIDYLGKMGKRAEAKKILDDFFGSGKHIPLHLQKKLLALLEKYNLQYNVSCVSWQHKKCSDTEDSGAVTEVISTNPSNSQPQATAISPPIIAVTFTPPVTQPVLQLSRDELLSQAFESYRQGKYATTINLCLKILGLPRVVDAKEEHFTEENYSIFEGIFHGYKQRKEYNAARKVLSLMQNYYYKHESLRKSLMDLMYNLANRYNRSGDYSNAVQIISDLFRYSAEAGEATKVQYIILMAQCFYNQGRYSEALDTLRIELTGDDREKYEQTISHLKIECMTRLKMSPLARQATELTSKNSQLNTKVTQLSAQGCRLFNQAANLSRANAELVAESSQVHTRDSQIIMQQQQLNAWLARQNYALYNSCQQAMFFSSANNVPLRNKVNSSEYFWSCLQNGNYDNIFDVNINGVLSISGNLNLNDELQDSANQLVKDWLFAEINSLAKNPDQSAYKVFLLFIAAATIIYAAKHNDDCKSVLVRGDISSPVSTLLDEVNMGYLNSCFADYDNYRANFKSSSKS